MALPEQLHSPSPDAPQDKCGTLAVFSKTGNAIHEQIPLMLYELHHRGRDSAGESTYNQALQSIQTITGEGSAGQVFHIKKDKKTGEKIMQLSLNMQQLISDRGIGHVRYGTSGNEHKDSSDGAQPKSAELKGRKITGSFNGNIPLPERRKLQSRISPDLPRGKFDTDDIVQAIVSADGETWEDRIKNGMDGIRGAYSINILTDTGEVFGLRGPSGHWPLWAGESDKIIVFASESVVNPELAWSEVMPGELVKATPQGVERKQLFEAPDTFSCLLHDGYGARPESLWRGNETYGDFRAIRLGEKLAELFPIDADYYDGIPNTGRLSARGYTRALGVPMTEIFQVLSDAERSYNAKNSEASMNVIKGKFKLNPRLVESGGLVGKRVVLTDDSMIKGAIDGWIFSTVRDSSSI